MLRDVTINITDGQMSKGTPGEGIHLKIGASPIQSEELISITSSMDVKRIRLKLGLSPLADAAIDSVDNGAAQFYCMSVAPSAAGAVGSVTKTGESTGTLQVTGTPNNAYDIVVTVTESGGLNAAAFSYSLNGGHTKSEELTVPSGGSYAVMDTGLTLKFTEGVQANDSFLEGDSFRAVASAPALSNDDILAAVDKIRNLKEAFEITHIVGPASAATWAAVAEKQQELEQTYKTPMMFVLEAYLPNAGESAMEYADGLIKARKSIGNTDLQVVTARCLYQRLDGVTAEINAASIAMGLYAQAKVQKSIAETKSFALPESKVLRLLPDGIEDEVEFLDAAGYVTLRKYIGLDGYYITDARMMCPEGSDYQYAEHTRVKNKIMRKIRKESLLQLKRDIDMANVDGDLQAIAKIIEAPIDQMAADKEISAGRIIIPEGQDILATEKVDLKARFTPKGYAREFEIDLGMERI